MYGVEKWTARKRVLLRMHCSFALCRSVNDSPKVLLVHLAKNAALQKNALIIATDDQPKEALTFSEDEARGV